MKESILSSLGFKLMLLLTAGLAVGTMGVVASKATAAMGENRIPKSGLEVANAAAEIMVAPTSILGAAVESPKKTLGKCIITLFSQKYDVTEPNSAGKNGDLFDCGGDMTSKYSAKYGNDVSKMQRYAIPSIIPTTTVRSVTAMPTANLQRNGENDSHEFEEDDDEREDTENKDRYQAKETEQVDD